MHVCGSACALASLSHMCGACAVSAGLGEEEPGDSSRAQRRDSGRQAGRRAGGRQAACQGAWAPTPGLLRLRGVVFRPGLDMLPRGPCVRPCAHTHPCKRGALPYPESYHFSPPGHSHAPPQVVLLKTNLHPSSVAPIHKTSSHSEKDSPLSAILGPLFPNQITRHTKGTYLLGHCLKLSPLTHTGPLLYPCCSLRD